MAKKKRTEAERQESNTFHERLLANADRLRQLAEKDQAELDAKRNAR